MDASCDWMAPRDRSIYGLSRETRRETRRFLGNKTPRGHVIHDLQSFNDRLLQMLDGTRYSSGILAVKRPSGVVYGGGRGGGKMAAQQDISRMKSGIDLKFGCNLSEA
ncbi:hypothetical protein J6590_047863 [Homalodisca vitripennis]|nr:hypothetical protein J6590_047863 [Homalodisca vitripennis]